MGVIINEQATVLNEEQPKVISKKQDKKILYNIIKRFIDIVAGIVGCIILIPMTIILEIVKLFSKENDGPLFYEQLRIGKNGKQFRIYKYRTMVLNADEKLWEYLNNNPKAKAEYTKYKKLKKDPRITKMGNFLRKTSLDEFPQFINILKGEMSLVGPRPYLYREKEDMGPRRYETIISVKPGLTGYWQVNGRNDKDFTTRVKMDVDYVKTRSLWNDFKFLIKTFTKVFSKNSGGK